MSATVALAGVQHSNSAAELPLAPNEAPRLRICLNRRRGVGERAGERAPCAIAPFVFKKWIHNEVRIPVAADKKLF